MLIATVNHFSSSDTADLQWFD